MVKIDLNCDIGESFGRYELGEIEEILQYVTSANIACGFHAGDPSVMRKTVALAKKYGVQVGAHPGFPDLAGFGRRNMDLSPQEAYDIVVYQIGALQGVLATQQMTMQHVKPHGALYNMAAKDAALAKAIAQAVYDVSPDLILFGLAGSELTKAGEAIGLQTVHEVFADRTYQQDGLLTSRKQADAMITDEEQAIQQIVRMAKEGKVRSQQGTDVSLQADSVCVHGDGEHALAFVKYARQVLDEHGIGVYAFKD